MRKLVLWSSSALVALLAVGSVFAWIAWQRLNAPLSIPDEGVFVEVESGASLRRVVEELQNRGLISHPRLVTAYARITGRATRIRSGEYRVRPPVTSVTLINQLVAGEVYLHQLTIVEGWRFADLLRAVRNHPAVTAGSLDDAGIMAALGAPGVHPEGQFFPDTYRFPRGTTDLELLRISHDAMVSRLELAWSMRAPDIAISTPYEALILASIIEKETALVAERRLISGVFHQRLRRNMRLQTDPTVIYGLGESFNGNLRRRDLESDTPYNTYTRGGLPPTPIALPGAGSLEAAVEPELGSAIYFVATGRPDGSHYFSSTLEEHEQRVRDYLRALRTKEPQ